MKHKTLSHRLPLPSTLSTPSHFSSVFFLVQTQTCSSSSPEQHHCSNKPQSPTKESCRKGKRFLWIDSYVGQSDQRGALLSEFQRGEWHRILRPTMELVFPSSRLLLDRCCCWKKMLMSAFWCGMIWIDNAFEWGCCASTVYWSRCCGSCECREQFKMRQSNRDKYRREMACNYFTRVSWKRVLSLSLARCLLVMCSLICGPAKTTYVYHLSPSNHKKGFVCAFAKNHTHPQQLSLPSIQPLTITL